MLKGRKIVQRRINGFVYVVFDKILNKFALILERKYVIEYCELDKKQAREFVKKVHNNERFFTRIWEIERLEIMKSGRGRIPDKEC
jgi:hypothetical protein